MGLWWRSRRDIERAHAYGFERIFAGSTMRLLEVRTRPLGEVAVVHARWEIRGQSAPDGTPGKPRRGVLVLVGVRRPTGWVAVSAQNTDRIPGTETWLSDETHTRGVSYRRPGDR